MFRNKDFSVKRRFSDFLGLYEKLSIKQSLQGCIIPSPPEKSVVGGSPMITVYFIFWIKTLSNTKCYYKSIFVSMNLPLPAGMTKVKVGKDDSSSVEFVERRRAALER